MLTLEKLEAILERLRTGSATEADLADLRQSLKLHGEIVQIGLQQGQYNVTIGNVEGQDIQFGDRIYYGADAEAIRTILREALGATELRPPSLEEQREAVCQFLQAVYERFSSVEFLHRRGEKVALRDQYIPIQVTLDKQPEKSSAGRYLGYVESEAELQRAYAFKKEDEKRTQVDWQEAKKSHQRIVVLADPGMGKTTLLRMEAGTIAQQEQEALTDGSKTLETVILPVWLRLSNLAEQVQQATDTVLEAIPKLVKAEWDDQQFAKLQPSLDAKLRTGQCLLLLDALDEVPRALRDRLTEKLNDFARNYSCPIICTSRIVGYASLLKGATEVEIVPFNPEQRAIYIEKWFTNAADVLDETVSAKNLIQELKSKPQIQGLAANPLLLSLVCSLYQEKGITLPARRCQVYAKAVEYMLGKWSRNSRKHTGAKLQAKTRLLEYLAYHFTCDGVEIFSEDQLYIKLGEYLENSKISSIFRKFETDDPVEELAAEDGILQKLSEKDYLFFHRTFQEYFTANYLVRAGKEGIQLAKAHLWNFEWHETISLMAGLMDEPLDLIQAMLNEKDDIFRTQLLLAGRCIAEVGSDSDLTIAKTIDQIYQFWAQCPDAEFIQSVVVALGQANVDQLTRLRKLLQDGNSNTVLIACAEDVLVKIGNDYAIEALAAEVNNPDSEISFYVIEALGQIGNDHAIDALIIVLNDPGNYFRWKAGEALGLAGNAHAIDALIAVLNDQDVDVRSSAAEALGRIGDDRVVDALIAALNDQDIYVRRAAAEALGRIGDDRVVDALIAALNDQDIYVRRAAAEALRPIGDDRAVNALIAALNDLDNEVRARAAWGLEKIGDDRAVNALITALHDLDKDVRRAAAEALGRIGNVYAINALIDTLNDSDIGWVAKNKLSQLENVNVYAIDALIAALYHQDSDVRSAAAQALRQIGNGYVIEVLMAIINNSYVRWAEAFSQSSDDHTFSAFLSSTLSYQDKKIELFAILLAIQIDHEIDAFLTALRDPDGTIGVNAAEAILKLDTVTIHGAFIAALDNWDSHIRGNAKRVLRQIGNDRILNVFIAEFNEQGTKVRGRVAKVLGQIGDNRAVDALIAALNDPKDDSIRELVADALGQIGDDRAVDALIAALNDPKDSVRRRVADALGQIGDDHAVDALIAALNDPEDSVREHAAEALGRIGDDHAVDALIAALNDPRDTVRECAAEALEQLSNDHTVLTTLLQWPDLDIYRNDIFQLARRLAIDVSRRGSVCVPVYPERGISLT